MIHAQRKSKPNASQQSVVLLHTISSVRNSTLSHSTSSFEQTPGSSPNTSRQAPSNPSTARPNSAWDKAIEALVAHRR